MTKSKKQLPTDFYQNNQLDPPSKLFDTLSDSFYFAKDLTGRFVYGNQLFLHHFKLEHLSELLGKTDLDILPKSIGEKIQKDDQKIMRTGQPIANIVELIPGDSSRMRWHVTTKSPLLNRQGKIVGIEGITRDLSLADKQLEPYSNFTNTVSYIQQNYSETIEIQKLAEQLHMSISTFERQFKARFGSSPSQFIKKTRIAAACKLLREHNNISQTASQCGFCDQSYFTKEFKSLMGLTPRQFQKKVASGLQKVDFIK